MSTVITKTIKLILFTAIFFVLTGAAGILLAIIFQGNIHPDDWKTTWQDILLLVFLGYIYFVIVWKIIKK